MENQRERVAAQQFTPQAFISSTTLANILQYTCRTAIHPRCWVGGFSFVLNFRLASFVFWHIRLLIVAPWTRHQAVLQVFKVSNERLGTHWNTTQRWRKTTHHKPATTGSSTSPTTHQTPPSETRQPTLKSSMFHSPNPPSSPAVCHHHNSKKTRATSPRSPPSSRRFTSKRPTPR